MATLMPTAASRTNVRILAMGFNERDTTRNRSLEMDHKWIFRGEAADGLKRFRILRVTEIVRRRQREFHSLVTGIHQQLEAEMDGFRTEVLEVVREDQKPALESFVREFKDRFLPGPDIDRK
ncbi:MAG TPA: hypothetical protein VHS31_11110 [Tepidisphaeraceae bacterium]|jgi:hypothetical protein|nr:hypothetical protein [Tepidisphaeraceae bacterium]